MSTHTITPASKVVRATVFLQGAELTRRVEFDAVAGEQTLIIAGLPDSLRPESVRGEAAKGLQLMNVTYAVDHLQEPEHTGLIAELSASLEANSDAMKQVEDGLRIIAAEEQFLVENRRIAGEDGVKLADLREMAGFYRTRLTEMADERRALERRQTELERERERLSAAIGTCYDTGYRSVGNIAVEMVAETAGPSWVEVSYFIHTAHWTPSYEIRVRDTDSPALLVGKADIAQTTGEDWTDVAVILSSGTPSVGGTHPELRPWYLSLHTLQKQRSMYQSFNAPMAAKMAEMEMVEDDFTAEPAMFARAAPAPEMRQGQVSIEFVLPGTVAIPSQDTGTNFDILREEMPADYEHYSVRKLEKDVFLLAKIRGWEHLSLLEGAVSIFLGNIYVGGTHLDPRRADEVLELSLGRDSGVIVTRIKGRDYASAPMIGKNQRASREWVLTARNIKQTPVHLRMLDQVPVPTDKSITVEVGEISGADYDAATGQLVWLLDLEPGASVQKQVKYDVSYPKDTTLILE